MKRFIRVYGSGSGSVRHPGQKAIAPKHAYSDNFLTEVESLANFLQNDIKFVQIPLVVAKILQFEIWWIPSFFAKPPIFEEAYLQNCSSDFKKIEKIVFFM